MEIRKRTRSGKSEKQTIGEPLRVVARVPDGASVTLSFSIKYYETQFNIQLSEREANDLATDIYEAINKIDANSTREL